MGGSMAFGGHTFSGLKIAGFVLAASAVAAGGTGYWLFVSEQRQYIVGRDFRLLTNLAGQMDNILEAEVRVLRNLQYGLTDTQLKDRWFKLRGKPYQASDIQFESRLDYSWPAMDFTLISGPPLALEVPLWRDPADHQATMVATLKLQPAFETIFATRARQGAFDTILLGTDRGQVLASAGSNAQPIRSSGLGVLSSRTADNKPVQFADLVQSTGMTNVSLAGVDHTLFVFPCCISHSANAKPLVLAGLVRAELIRSASWAIPTTLVKAAMLSLLMALVVWPFLKLILLGDRQHVNASDFFQLGAASVVALALVTIVLLDAIAYMRLNDDTDAQLKGLADELDEHATNEVHDAFNQLDCFEEALTNHEYLVTNGMLPSALDKLSSAVEKQELACKPASGGTSVGQSQDERLKDQLEPDAPLEWTYPFFDAVSFVNREGMQVVKVGTSASAPNKISVAERDYFKTIVRQRGWQHKDFCKDTRCAFESVRSWTTGEVQAVLAKEVKQQKGMLRSLPVGVVSFPMRSLIGPVLPPGFAFAIIDQTGRVTFHSDPQRNGSEDFFAETDNNRRLRAQVAAHSAESLNINYWGSAYRAYLKPMALPELYVVAMAQRERAWAINREWLVVALIFLAIYLTCWVIVALTTLVPNASWVWPDSRRSAAYRRVSGLCTVCLVVAATAAWKYDRNLLLSASVPLPLVAWAGAYILLRHRPASGDDDNPEPLVSFSCAAVLMLLVTGVVPGALLFLASYQLHARSYIKNSQLMVARRLTERVDRLREEYLTDGATQSPRREAARHVGKTRDRDIYVDFLYNTSIKSKAERGERDAQGTGGTANGKTQSHIEDRDMVLSFLEDYLPYYADASVEWRELLHDSAGDASWTSSYRYKGANEEIVLTSPSGSVPFEVTSLVPSATRGAAVPTAIDTARRDQPGPVGTSGADGGPSSARGSDAPRDSSTILLVFSGLALLALTWGVVLILNKRLYLVGIAKPLWARNQLTVSAGENVLVLCDRTTKANQVRGTTPLRLGPIVQNPDAKGAWRRALVDLDERTGDGAVLVDDFDEDLDDAHRMDHKLALLDELVSDQSRTVILLSHVSIRGLSDTLRHSSRGVDADLHKSVPGGQAAPTDVGGTALERWRRILGAFVVVDRRKQEGSKAPLEVVTSPPAAEPVSTSRQSVLGAPPGQPSAFERLNSQQRKVRAFLESEGRAHPFVKQVCDDLRLSDGAGNGDFTLRQAFDELAERTAHFYCRLWASCSKDEKVVLAHIAQHGLANASARSVVRRLLGRRLLCKDPALRPMNETFRRFVLSRECARQVRELETEQGPSVWDRLHVPLGLGFVGVAMFLFATQKELYNAVLGVTTAAAASLPTLIRAVATLVGRPTGGNDAKA
jgi:hypothetical protein